MFDKVILYLAFIVPGKGFRGYQDVYFDDLANLSAIQTLIID